jgi:hypothetical protein
MADLNKTHQDAALKGAVLGVLTYGAAKAGVTSELVALALPLVTLGLSWVSTKVGDKNTALLVDLAVKAVEATKKKNAPKTSSKVVAKKAPAKKK